MSATRRSVLLAAVGAGAALLAGCRGTDDDPQTGASSASGSGSGFPVTIAHKFGSTTIRETPKRVVCVGLTEQDMLLALGVVPVGVSSWLGSADHEIYPWAKPKLGSATPPTVLKGNDGIPVEKVAALKPDLIIGQYAGVTKAEYDRLSKLAPTVAQPKGYIDYGVPWEMAATNVAKAVGKPQEGKEIVDGVRKQIAEAKRSHPQFRGKTGVVLTAYDGVYVYGPQDPRNRLLTDLGFTFPAKFKSIGGGKEFGGSISPERTKELDFDTVVWITAEKQVAKSTGGLWAQTKAAKQGRDVFVPESYEKGTADANHYAAICFATPLSIPYLLRSYLPQLSAAVDGKAATKVPAPKA